MERFALTLVCLFGLFGCDRPIGGSLRVELSAARPVVDMAILFEVTAAAKTKRYPMTLPHQMPPAVEYLFLFPPAALGDVEVSVTIDGNRVTKHATVAADEESRLQMMFGEPEEIPDLLPPTTPVPNLVAEPSSHAFGEVATNGLARRVIRVHNQGTGASSPLAVSVDGGPAFSLGDNACMGVTLAPDASCDVELQFRPIESIAYVGALHVGAVVVAVTGSGTAPGALSVDPADVGYSFPPIVLGAAPPPDHRFRLTNTGGVALGPIEPIQLSGQAPAQFSVRDNLCTGATLAPNATCDVTIHFEPTAAGTHAANFSIVIAGTPRLTIEFVGVAKTPATVALPTTEHDFAGVPLGSTVEASFAIENNGDVDIAGAALTFSDLTADLVVKPN